MPSTVATETAAGTPDASRRSQREPVDPCVSTRSPQRATMPGSATGLPSSSAKAKCPSTVASSRASRSARSADIISGRRVAVVRLIRASIAGAATGRTDMTSEWVAAVFNALHWIDPAVRFAKPAALLAPGSAFVIAACHWARPVDAEPFWTDVQQDYAAVGFRGAPRPPPDQV